MAEENSRFHYSICSQIQTLPKKKKSETPSLKNDAIPESLKYDSRDVLNFLVRRNYYELLRHNGFYSSTDRDDVLLGMLVI